MCPGVPYHRCVLEISYQLSRRSIAPTANTATMPANIAKSLPHIAAQLPPATSHTSSLNMLAYAIKFCAKDQNVCHLPSNLLHGRILQDCVESSYYKMND